MTEQPTKKADPSAKAADLGAPDTAAQKQDPSTKAADLGASAEPVSYICVKTCTYNGRRYKVDQILVVSADEKLPPWFERHS